MHAIVIHGWMEYPDFAWIPWLCKKLEDRGYTTEVPLLPNAELPDPETWIQIIRHSLKSPDTVVICHSLGCLATLRALQGYTGESLAQVVMVAGFARPFIIPFQPWFTGAPFDFDAIKLKAKKWTFLHSEKDLFVPYTEGAWLASQFKEPLNTVSSGHMTQEEGYMEMPEIMNAII